MCLTVYEFPFISFEIFNFVLNYILIVTFWIFTYYKIFELCELSSLLYEIIEFFLFCDMFGSVLECYELTGVSFLWPWLVKAK